MFIWNVLSVSYNSFSVVEQLIEPFILYEGIFSLCWIISKYGIDPERKMSEVSVSVKGVKEELVMMSIISSQASEGRE